jgi:hypothetical protein
MRVIWVNVVLSGNLCTAAPPAFCIDALPFPYPQGIGLMQCSF